MNRVLVGLLSGAAFLPGTALAADMPAAEPRILSCAAPFTADATEASLKAAFGAENVEYKTVPGPEGTEMQATVIYPNDTARMVTVLWGDEANRARPVAITVQADYMADPEGMNPWKTEILWKTPEGLRVGSTTADVEKVNGKPFLMSGFGWDYGGFAMGWEGGALDSLPGGCSLSMRFSPTADTGPGATGDTQVASDSPDMVAAKARVTEITIGYAVE
jgi:hypothetical protein